MDDENTFQEQLIVYAGSTGAAGPQGKIGEQGYQGLVGDGPPGVQGVAGLDGLQGLLGAQGNQGLVGDGPPGVQGNVGAQGNQGRQGVAGGGFTFTRGSTVLSLSFGNGSFSHGLGTTPTTVLLTNGDQAAGPEYFNVASLTATTVNITCQNPAGSSGARRVNWIAIA